MHVYVGISIHGCMWSILFRSYVANKIIIYFLFIECSCWFIITIMVQFYHRPRRPRRAPDNQRTYQIKFITDNMIQLIFWWMVYAIINCQFRTLSIGNISHPQHCEFHSNIDSFIFSSGMGTVSSVRLNSLTFWGTCSLNFSQGHQDVNK